MTAETQTPEFHKNDTFIIMPDERIRLDGDDGLAICGVIDLAPEEDGTNPVARIVVIDVGFKQRNGKFGPYDIDGSGNKRTFDNPYVLVRQENTQQGRTTNTFDFKTGEVVEVGRETASGKALGIDNELHISRRHLSVMSGAIGSIVVTDLRSTNGTQIKSAKEATGQLSAEAEFRYGYTVDIRKNVHQAGKTAGYTPEEVDPGWGNGVYEGRNVIGRDTPINGGVYPVGTHEGESIVVDDKKYPLELNEAYDAVIRQMESVKTPNVVIGAFKRRRAHAEQNSDSNTEKILENVFEIVSGLLKYDLSATEALARDMQKITINSYIAEGVGVCRTQAVLSAYIVERLISEGKLDGRISIDRNEREHVDRAGHAWARYTDPEGKVYIIDPAQKKVGPLSQLISDGQTWDYRRSEDFICQMLEC